jgi:Secretion system C-terminal sorting domain
MRHYLTFNFKIWCTALLLLPASCWAQSMALQTLGAVGGTTTNNGYSLSWTVGETSIQNGQQADVYVGAGFQQSPPKKTSVAVVNAVQVLPDNHLLIYPNPASDNLTIESKLSGSYTARLCNLLGVPVSEAQPFESMGILYLSNLPAGTYFLQVFDTQNRQIYISKIQHFN